MNLKNDIMLMKEKCGQIALGHGRCHICGCITAKRGMTIHHLWYLKNNDIIYKDYPKTSAGTLEYYTALYPLIYKNPKRFMFLCNTHHFALEKFCHYGDKMFKALCLARKMTKT